MPFPFRRRAAVLLSVFALMAALLAVPAATLRAQTLRHRPPAEPQLPAAVPAAVQPAGPATLPAGTSLQVETTRRYGLKKGETIEARLMHPIYADNRLEVAAGTMLRGRVVGLKPNHKERVAGRLNGDFTPFRTAQVRFDALELPGGAVAIDTEAATDGAPVLYLTKPGAAKHHSFLGRQWHAAIGLLHEPFLWFHPPGVGDRVLELLYQQLPYHPQRIAPHTAWSFELKAPVQLPQEDAAAQASATPVRVAEVAEKKDAADPPETWHVHAVLEEQISSATAKTGDAVKALVVEPVFDKDKHLVVPQGSVLMGKVTHAKAARSFGRSGRLRFTFDELRLPEGYRHGVEGTLGGAATNRSQDLQLDAEGGIQPNTQSRAFAPLLLGILAQRAMDFDDPAVTEQNGVASNGFGVIGRTVAMVVDSRNLAAGIGFYAAFLHFSQNFLCHGEDVVFQKDMRIEIETTPMHAPVLKPAGQ